MRSSVLALTLTTAALAPALQASSARACGGFFCNATSPVPIIQAGERVLFAAHDGLVTMHIEIVYQGDPTQFGWILPLADMPMDAAGHALPLEKAVEISSQRLFPLLQQLTDPQFILNRDPNDTEPQCPFPTGTFADSSAPQDAATGSDSFNPPSVVVLEEAAVGPYNAQLIQADSSEALYEWLGDNGYIQDPKAQPILDHYVTKGFKFLGIRLQSGKSTGDLRPLAITLGEGSPCVPLVLTQIAATPDMPILVWVLGAARAIPKNFIHAVIDERAFAFPGAAGYQQLLSQAIDQAGHRAWVTEFAGPTDSFRGFLQQPGASTVELRKATSLTAVIEQMSNLGAGPGDLDFDATLRAHVPLPEGLRGYPYGNCQLCQSCPDAEAVCAENGLPNAEHVTTDADFYGYIYYWAGADAAGTFDLGVDVPALVQAMEDEVITPRRNIETLFANATTITRFFTLIDPDEMTRDPIFAFNPSLPAVSNLHSATYDLIDCDGTVRVRYTDGTSADMSCTSCTFGGGLIQALPGAKPLLYPEVLDEEGNPVRFSTSQAGEVDRLLDGASPGIPTLPANFNAEPPDPPNPPQGELPSTRGDDSGCSGGALSPLALLLALALVRRRRSIRS